MSALANLYKPKTPLCWPFKSAEKTSTFYKSLKNGLKKARVKTVILSSGCFRVSARKTGTVIATSPIAERRMTRMFLDGLGIIFHLKTSSILRLRSV